LNNITRVTGDDAYVNYTSRFRNATKQNSRFNSAFQSRISLTPFHLNLQRIKEALVFYYLAKKEKCESSLSMKTALTIPVIDKQYAFTQYLIASNADARGLKLAPSSLATENYWNVLVTCEESEWTMNFRFKESPTRFVHQIVKALRSEGVHPDGKQRPPKSKPSRSYCWPITRPIPILLISLTTQNQTKKEYFDRSEKRKFIF